MRNKHVHDEIVPPLKALRALDHWIIKHNIGRKEFGQKIGLLPTQVTRLFNRKAYLTDHSREAIENMTGGKITSKVLTGEEQAPRIRDSEEELEEQLGAEFEQTEDVDEKDTEETFERMTKAYALSALKTVAKLMKSKKTTPIIQFKCAEIIISYGIGRPRQAEKRKPPELQGNDSELLEKLILMAERINGATESTTNPSNETGATQTAESINPK